MNDSKAVEFALQQYKRKHNYLPNGGHPESTKISPQGYGGIDVFHDTTPFLKVAAIRRYLNEHGDFDHPKVYE